MSNIDLSKAKIGDKFRTKDGQILEYIGESLYDFPDRYLLEDEIGHKYRFCKDGNYMSIGKNEYDLVEQVFDKPLDELIEESTKQFRENDDVIASEQELQRRQEVVELADRIFFSERGNMFSFKECIEVAEHSVNVINQYLKEGKL